jgi:hypothetical protein
MPSRGLAPLLALAGHENAISRGRCRDSTPECTAGAGALVEHGSDRRRQRCRHVRDEDVASVSDHLPARDD